MSRSYREHLDRLPDEQYAEGMQYPDDMAYLCMDGYLERASEPNRMRRTAGLDAMRLEENVIFLQAGEQPWDYTESM